MDILIGTHRLLSRDVHFHDLGLLIVDEEQRFGVTHKERLKEMSRNVDVLTMTATPIPRTLNMSLVGLRDMSVIETPPKDRLAIQTVVAPFSEGLVRRGHRRGDRARRAGLLRAQPRASRFIRWRDLVQKLVPKARVVVGHGQMGERELEKVMLQFVRDEADVLVSTTIIENGLDIPRANTILINRADRFGLSELYQLRGRVGRSNQRAYAYLLVPPEVTLTPLAQAAAGGVARIQRTGRGFPHRGAGSGIARRRQSAGPRAARPHQRHRLRSLLPDAGARGRRQEGRSRAPEVARHAQSGTGYSHPAGVHPQREPAPAHVQANCRHRAATREREAVRRELADRFGPPPPAVDNLLDYAVLKSLCERLADLFGRAARGRRSLVKFHPTTPVRPERLVRWCASKRACAWIPAAC